MLIAGVDEAGRGPVFGPMVMATVVIQEKEENELKELGVKDSKLLSKKKRKQLYGKILDIVKDYKIIKLSPEIIDRHLFSQSSSLNKLEAKTTAEMLNTLKAKKAYIDLPDRNRKRYTDYIKNNLKNKNIELIAEHGADKNYVVVGAASILAKVTRDTIVDELRRQLGEDIGSGYMTDKVTVRFLEDNWNNDKVKFFRKSWASWKNIRDRKLQKGLKDYF